MTLELALYLGLSIPVIIFCALGWHYASRRAHRLEARLLGLSDASGSAGVDAARVERLEQVVETLAEEIERLDGGQKLLSKVVTGKLERLVRPASPVPRPGVTPR